MKQTVQYNEHVFEFPRLRVTEEAIMDPARLAQVGTRFEFTVTGHVTASTLDEMKTKLTCMRARLATPRKAFAVDWANDDGSGSVRYFEFDHTTDIDHGPIPGALEVTSFAGGRAAMYSWSVSCVVKDCATACVIGGTTPNQVLSVNRVWTHAVDENGFTTRTVAGKLVVRANASVTADQFRYTCVPGVPTNYRRVSQHWVQSADGRELDFAVTDVEQMWTLPLGISGGRAEFSCRIQDLGAIVDYRLAGEFKAPATVSKATILNRIFLLAAAKFPTGGPGFFFEECEFSESVYENAITFSMCAKSAVGQTPNGLPDFAAGLNPLTITPPGQNGQSQKIGPYGGDDVVDSGVVAIRPLPYDACVAGTATGASTAAPGSLSYGTGAATPTLGAPGSYNNTGISDGHAANPFESLHEVYSYELDNKLAFFDPKVAGKPPISQQTAMPSLTLIQAGYFRQYAKTSNDVSKAPKPGLGANGRLLHAVVEPEAPVPVGSGATNLYTVRWRYVVRYTKAIALPTLADAELAFPYDPRRPDASGTKTGETLPAQYDLAVIPTP